MKNSDQSTGGKLNEGRWINVANIHTTTSKNDLQTHFGRCGRINQILMLGRRGFAMIEFQLDDFAKIALTFNNTFFQERCIKVTKISHEHNMQNREMMP